jgi:SAM-dependent methyltransferase
MTQHTGASFKAIAAKYAATVDSRPWNAHYERPAVISLLPPLENTKVLDVGCGSGWYAEYLVAHGATVTAFDFNAEFVAFTRTRIANRATVLQADLAEPLVFAADEEFDLAVCPLVMHYLRDWKPALRELHRVLKPLGVLVFSTHHPFMDWKLFNKEDYFATEVVEDNWEGIGRVTYYRRPLTAISEALRSAGFWIERLLEPQPTEDFQRVNLDSYERLSKNPWFLVIRARKNGDALNREHDHQSAG